MANTRRNKYIMIYENITYDSIFRTYISSISTFLSLSSRANSYSEVAPILSKLISINHNLKFNEYQGYLLNDDEFSNVLFYCRECKHYSAPKFIIDLSYNGQHETTYIDTYVKDEHTDFCNDYEAIVLSFSHPITHVQCGHCCKVISVSNIIRTSGTYPIGINIIDNDDKIDISVLYADISFHNSRVIFKKDRAKIIFNKKNKSVYLIQSRKENIKNVTYNYNDIHHFISNFCGSFGKELVEYAAYIYNNYVHKNHNTAVIDSLIQKAKNADKFDSYLFSSLYYNIAMAFRCPYVDTQSINFIRKAYPSEFRRLSKLDSNSFDNYFISQISSMSKKFKKVSIEAPYAYFVYKKLYKYVNRDLLYTFILNIRRFIGTYTEIHIAEIIKNYSRYRIVRNCINFSKIVTATTANKNCNTRYINYIFDIINGILMLYKDYKYTDEQIKQLCVGSVNEIHDKINDEIQILIDLKMNQEIYYDDKERALESNINSLRFFLPEDTCRLSDIGRKMKICVGTMYRYKALDKSSTIVAVVNEEGKYVACIEVNKFMWSVVQAKGIYNRRLEGDVLDAVIEWVCKNKLFVDTNDLPVIRSASRKQHVRYDDPLYLYNAF